ncbi:MAG: hypothetical protein AAF226_02745, partial [Verrucomicrobiota bacterium]
LALVPFLFLVSALGALLMATAVRWLNRRQILVGVSVLILFAIGSAVKVGLTDKKIVEESGLSAALTFQRVLSHTKLTANRGVPSTWIASSVVEWSRPYRYPQGALYPCLLVSNALMALLLLSAAGNRWFYRSWNRSIQSSAHAALRRNLSAEEKSRGALTLPKRSFLSGLIGRPLAAVARKDLLTFVREPAQWVQFSVVFGLLALYASGLQKINSHIEQPRDLYLVAFLNLAMSALALSTLTTRFVFPQFSLEGRKLWVLAMSPLKLEGIVTQKFVTSTLATGLAVVGVLLISSFNLSLPAADTCYFLIAMAMLAIGLNAIAVGCGVLFPNLEETNTAKMVSGFGGTLCLVASFVFVVGIVLMLALARMEIFKSNLVGTVWYQDTRAVSLMIICALMTLIVSAVLIFFSRKSLKRLEIISK